MKKIIKLLKLSTEEDLEIIFLFVLNLLHMQQ